MSRRDAFGKKFKEKKMVGRKIQEESMAIYFQQLPASPYYG
jgi:hypothetical protein